MMGPYDLHPDQFMDRTTQRADQVVCRGGPIVGQSTTRTEKTCRTQDGLPDDGGTLFGCV